MYVFKHNEYNKAHDVTLIVCVLACLAIIRENTKITANATQSVDTVLGLHRHKGRWFSALSTSRLSRSLPTPIKKKTTHQLLH